MTESKQKRLAKNTIFLYVRMVIVMLVSLYMSRVILNALGVDDYGIYSAVGGFVAMFAVISNSLSAAISRFITFELGKGDKEKLQKIFSSSIILQLILSAIIIIIAESIGLWFVNNKMTIPEGRIFAANCVYQLSIITFIVNLLSVPYNACIIAHERMKTFAYIGVVEAIGKLLIAFAIAFSPFDKLIFYAVLICLFAVFIRLLYTIYCKKHFSECEFRMVYDKSIIKNIFNFAGWNFIGASSGVLRDQGLNVLLNVFFTPVVNAARGISMSISSAVTQFSTNFLMALNPQITKSYASNDREYCSKLVFKGARLSFFLLLIVSIPILIETHQVLLLWLKIIPAHLVNFTRLILIYVMTESISYTMITLMLATGDIRNYQIIVGGCQLLNLPVAYILLKNGLPPESVFIVSIVIAFCCLILRLIMLRRMVNFNIIKFVREVLIKILIVSVISSIIPLYIYYSMDETILRLVLVLIVSLVSTGMAIFIFGCTNGERQMIKTKAVSILKIRNK